MCPELEANSRLRGWPVETSRVHAVELSMAANWILQRRLHP